MMQQSIYKPMAQKFRSREDVRVFEEQLRNLQRLIDYNNRRIKAGLKPLPYPSPLVDWDHPTNRDQLNLVTR